ncbi:hypothetical protein HAX54_037359, partial [Datura stramonium]|nr:hypothetical protein [Datura stramonium]
MTTEGHSGIARNEGIQLNSNAKQTAYGTERSDELVDHPGENQHNVNYSGQTSQGRQPSSCIFTQSQYDQIVHLLNQAQASTSVIPGSSTNATANTVGKDES